MNLQELIAALSDLRSLGLEDYDDWFRKHADSIGMLSPADFKTLQLATERHGADLAKIYTRSRRNARAAPRGRKYR